MLRNRIDLGTVAACLITALPSQGCRSSPRLSGRGETIATAPSNRELISAMPSGTESVLVVRTAALDAHGSIFQGDSSINKMPMVIEETLITSEVMAEIEHAGVLATALGGSSFTMPPDTGMTGNFNERAIYVLRRPADRLAERLEAGEGILGLVGSFDISGVRVFRGEIPKDSGWGERYNCGGESWFVALPDRHTVVTAESEKDIAEMLKALREKRAEVPAQWRAAADGHNLESPIVMLRAYAPLTGKEPIGIHLSVPTKEAGVTHVGISLMSVKHLKLKFTMKAGDAQEAVRWFKWTFLPDELYLWKVKGDETDVRGTISGSARVMREHSMMFVFCLLFGMFVMI